MTEQEKKKQEEDLLKWNIKKEKIKQEKKTLKKNLQKLLLQPNIKKNLIVWIDKNNNGSFYEGNFGKEKCFEIKRGILTFSLKTIHKELKSSIKSNSSIELIKLQEKANQILWENPKFLLKFKPVS